MLLYVQVYICFVYMCACVAQKTVVVFMNRAYSYFQVIVYFCPKEDIQAIEKKASFCPVSMTTK